MRLYFEDLKIDWKEVQTFYDSGKTVREAQEVFNFSSTHRGTAIKKGLLVMRSDSDCQRLSKNPYGLGLPPTDKLKSLSLLYNNGASGRDLLKYGYKLFEIREAVNQGFIIPRTILEAKDNRIKIKGNNHPPGEEARKATSIRQSLHNSGGRSKWYEVAGQKVQGTWERNIALKFEELGIKWYKPKVNADVWPYTIDNEKHNYSPDFYLSDYDVYLEVKGHWWGNDKEKMEAVLKEHSDKRLILVLKEEYQKILGGELVW